MGDGVLIFDDTVEEKAWMDENDLICQHYDHCAGRNIKGINMLNCLYHVNGISIPVDTVLPVKCFLHNPADKVCGF